MNHPARLAENAGLSLRDQVQLALALSDGQRLKQLLTESWPAVAAPQTVGAVYAEVSPAMGDGASLDGLVHFEHIHCCLAEEPVALPEDLAGDRHSQVQALTRCQSELHTLAKDLSLSEAIALLSHAGFGAESISTILNLPHDAWFKSWWYITDHPLYPTIPFLRLMRSRRYGDGTFLLQYADRYGSEPPRDFRARPVDIPIVIQVPAASFGETMAQINGARRLAQADQVVLIAERTLSDLEIEGFQRQGVSLFTTQQLRTPTVADCQRCDRPQCPLAGQWQSPVSHCHDYIARVGGGDAG